MHSRFHLRTSPRAPAAGLVLPATPLATSIVAVEIGCCEIIASCSTHGAKKVLFFPTLRRDPMSCRRLPLPDKLSNIVQALHIAWPTDDITGEGAPSQLRIVGRAQNQSCEGLMVLALRPRISKLKKIAFASHNFVDPTITIRGTASITCLCWISRACNDQTHCRKDMHQRF